jgi:hypothetical protein
VIYDQQVLSVFKKHAATLDVLVAMFQGGLTNSTLSHFRNKVIIRLSERCHFNLKNDLKLKMS